MTVGTSNTSFFDEGFCAVVANVFVEHVEDAVVVFTVVDTIATKLAVVRTIAIGIDIFSARAAVLAEEFCGNLLCLV